MSLEITSMANQAVDPDAQATTTDFLDFTEYVPSDLLRSLTLIRGLDATYLTNSYAVHDLTSIYSTLPALPPSSRPDPVTLRKQISLHLDRAIDSRENAFAEADRAYQVVFRNTNRLQSILSKLEALPEPPSRDPTPQAVSPQEIKRSRSGRKLETTLPQRVILHGPKYSTTPLTGQKRKRQLIIPGEPLPAYDPDSPMASTEVSDTETLPSPSKVADRPMKSLKLKGPKPEKGARTLTPGRESVRRTPATERRPRIRPQPPPPDAVIGGPYRPWLRLTEYEVYRIQKDMKKGAEWAPPDGLYKKRLREDGRGLEAYQSAKLKAEKEGLEFVDVDAKPEPKPKVDEAVKKIQPTTPGRTEPSQETIVVAKSEKKNTESKKPKKTVPRGPVQDDAAKKSALDLEKIAMNLGNISGGFRALFNPSPSTPASQPHSRKRRKQTSSGPSARVSEQRATSTPKDSKTDSKIPSLTPTISAPASGTTTTQIPLKITVPAQQITTSTSLSSPVSPKQLSRASSRIASRQASIVPKADPDPSPSVAPVASRQSSIRPPSRRSIANSVELPVAPVTVSHNLRRNSTPGSNLRKTPRPTTSPKTEPTAIMAPGLTMASRRSKRPQGAIAQTTEEGAAIIKTSRRKGNNPKAQPKSAHPNALASAATGDSFYMRTDIDGKVEMIPEDEERYCICDDVSYGDMIACDHGVSKDGCAEWFHMGCVGLHDMPGRTVKWYCPNCRVKLKKGENTNGLVGRIMSR